MPNPETIPATLALQGTPPITLPAGTAGQVLVSDGSGNLNLGPVPAQMTPTAVITTNYTASPGDFVVCNVTSASITITLPSAPANGTMIGVKLIAFAGSNLIAISASGTDVFEVVAGPTQISVRSLWRTVILQYNAANGVWARMSGFVSMVNFGDIFYGAPSGNGPAGEPLVLPGNTTTARQFLTQTGAGGGVSAAPAWAAIAATDLPTEGPLPADLGWLAWSSDPGDAGASGAPAAGTITLIAIWLRQAATITNVIYQVSTAGSGLTAGQNLIGVYDSGGTQRAITADQTANWGTAQARVVPFTAAYSAAPGKYWLAILSNGTTPPTFRCGPTAGTLANAGLSGASLRYATNLTAQTSLPASLTLANNVTTGNVAACLALS